MATTETKSVLVAVKLAPTMHRSVKARAKRDDVSASHVIRCALRDYLKGQVTK